MQLFGRKNEQKKSVKQDDNPSASIEMVTSPDELSSPTVTFTYDPEDIDPNLMTELGQKGDLATISATFYNAYSRTKKEKYRAIASYYMFQHYVLKANELVQQYSRSVNQADLNQVLSIAIPLARYVALASDYLNEVLKFDESILVNDLTNQYSIKLAKESGKRAMTILVYLAMFVFANALALRDPLSLCILVQIAHAIYPGDSRVFHKHNEYWKICDGALQSLKGGENKSS